MGCLYVSYLRLTKNQHWQCCIISTREEIEASCFDLNETAFSTRHHLRMNTTRTFRYYLFGFLPLLKIKENERNYRLLLFAFLPLLTASKREGVVSWRLLGFLPLLKTKGSTSPSDTEVLKDEVARLKKQVSGTEKKTRALIRSTEKRLSYEVLKQYYQEKSLYCDSPGISPEPVADCELIISLTTYSKRINNVALVIESCMQQTLKANKIILWLDESFRNKCLPAALQRQQKRGLIIDYCEDIGPYKKLIPTLERYPNAAIITVDDDALYDANMVDRMVRAWKERPGCVYCNRMHRMLFDEKGYLLPYKQWDWLCKEMNTPNHLNFPTGVGGILYPPGSLAREVLNKDAFMKLCPRGDDIWFKAMACLAGHPTCRVYTSGSGFGFTDIEDDQDIALWKSNVSEEKNDIQIQATFSQYGLYQLLKTVRPSS